MKLSEAYNKIVLERYAQLKGASALVSLQNLISTDPAAAQKTIDEFMLAEKDYISAELANLLFTMSKDE